MALFCLSQFWYYFYMNTFFCKLILRYGMTKITQKHIMSEVEIIVCVLQVSAPSAAEPTDELSVVLK